MKMPSTWSLLLVLAAGLAPAAFSEVITVKNTGPAKPPGAVHLTEQWRVGGEDSDILFGVVSEAVSDEHGNVYILDNQLCNVVVISPEGEHIGTLSREGEGPGEVRMPRDVVILDDGSIGIALLFPSKLVRLTPEGEPLPSMVMGAKDGDSTTPYVTLSCEARAGTLLMAGQHSVPVDVGQERRQFLCIVNEDRTMGPPLCESSYIMDFTTPLVSEKELIPSFYFSNTIGPDGRVYAALSRDEYSIGVFSPVGTLEKVITRKFDNRPRTSRETRRIDAVFAAADRQTPRRIESVIEPKNPVTPSLFVDEDNRLWVQNSHSGDNQPEGVLMTYDLFDADGNFERQVAIHCEGDPAYDELKFLPDGRILLIKGMVLARWSAFDFGTVDWPHEEEEVSSMEIICFSRN